jgi:ATP-dependent Zn protease
VFFSLTGSEFVEMFVGVGAARVDLQGVAARTTGFAGADLASLVNEATLLAARAAGFSAGIGRFQRTNGRRRDRGPQRSLPNDGIALATHD